MIAPRWWLSIRWLLALGLLPSLAVADGPASSGLPVPLDAHGALAVDRAGLEAPATVAAQLVLELRERPLRLPSLPGSELRFVPVDREVMARLGLHVGLLSWLQVGVTVPVGWSSFLSEPMAPPQVGAGDLRLYLKAGVKAGKDGGPHLRFAALLGLTAPTGDPAAYRSDGVWIGEPRLALDLAAWRLTLSLSAGARLRSTVEAAPANPSGALVTMGPELVWGGALALRAHEVISLAVEAAGSEALSPFADTERRRTFALLGSVWLQPSPAWSVFAGGGRSLDLGGQAARGDDLRVMLGVTWRPMANAAAGGAGSAAGAGATVGSGAAPAADRDGDGVPDARDRCPDETEDLDGYRDEDGCIDTDNDGDGVPDVLAPGAPGALDGCPDAAEDRDGFDDEDGCPDPDNDGDGVPDGEDRCPDEAETPNGWQDGDGCPDEAPAPAVSPGTPGAPATDETVAPKRRRKGGSR